MELDALSPKMKLLLSAIPKRNEEVEWMEEDGKVVLIYPKNFTRFERFLHRHLGGPDNIRRPLDDKGTYIWKMCDGDHNVHEICKDIYKEFKEDIEPVVRRVWGFLETLLKLGLITLEKPETEEDKEKEKERQKETEEGKAGEEKNIKKGKEGEDKVGEEKNKKKEKTKKSNLKKQKRKKNRRRKDQIKKKRGTKKGDENGEG